MTKGSDSRRDPDEEAAEADDAQRFRIDRVFIPAKRESSGPVTPPPMRERRLTRTPAAGAAQSSPTLPAAQPALSETAETEFHRQLSKLQRQLSDVQLELANKEEELAAEVERRAAYAAEHDEILGDQQVLASRLEEVTRASESRVAELEGNLHAALQQLAGMARERDELVRQRDDLAQHRDRETRSRDDEAKARIAITEHRDAIAVELDAARRERDEAVAQRDLASHDRTAAVAELEQRLAALEEQLSETHKAWATERKEVVDTQTTELAEMEETHKLALDAAVVSAKAAEIASAGIQVATARAEADRDKSRYDGELVKLRGELGTVRAQQAAELAKLAEKHKQDLAQVVINNAADQGVMARKHGEALQRAEARTSELERALGDAKRATATVDTRWEAKHAETARALADARAEIAQLSEQVKAGEALLVELTAMRGRLEASEARTAELRAKLRALAE